MVITLPVTELFFSYFVVYIFHPWLSPEQLRAPAGQNASVDLGPELLTHSVYFYWDVVSDAQQKYCAV